MLSLEHGLYKSEYCHSFAPTLVTITMIKLTFPFALCSVYILSLAATCVANSPSIVPRIAGSLPVSPSAAVTVPTVKFTFKTDLEPCATMDISGKLPTAPEKPVICQSKTFLSDLRPPCEKRSLSLSLPPLFQALADCTYIFQ
jgi:hypothetical protein